MMIEPQALEYKEQDETGPSLTVTFTDQKQPLALPVKDIIETGGNIFDLSLNVLTVKWLYSITKFRAKKLKAK